MSIIGVTSISNYAFYEYSGLIGALTIPNSVASIGDRAFGTCIGLRSVCRTTPQNINANVFYGITLGNVNLYVQPALVSTYGSATVWRDFNQVLDMMVVAGVALNKTVLGLTIGANETLTATIAPVTAANQNVTWSSTNTAVATVNNGLVTALSAGTTTITATTADGGYTATCAITVANDSTPQLLAELAALQAMVSRLQANSIASHTTISDLQAQLVALPDTVTVIPAANISVSGATLFPSVFNPFNTEYMVDLSTVQPSIITITIGNINYVIMLNTKQ